MTDPILATAMLLQEDLQATTDGFDGLNKVLKSTLTFTFNFQDT